MKKISLFSGSIFLLFITFCGKPDLKAPPPPPFVYDVPDNWAAHQKERAAMIDSYISQNRYAYNRFVDMAMSETDGIPFFILKLLPDLAPEYWGKNGEFLSVIGLEYDSRMGKYPVPRGIGFSGTFRKEPLGNIDYATFTCGGCHIGQVRLKDGKIRDLTGGINTRFNVILYRQKIVFTLNKIYNGESDSEKRKELVKEAILSALRKRHKSDPNYFYNNYSDRGRHFDAAYEKAQVKLFIERADALISGFIKHQENIYAGWGVIAKKLYPAIQESVMSGFGGMEDAISFNTAATYIQFQESFFKKLISPLVLPSVPGMTDIMAIWDQDSRNPRWNEKKDDLINGGGQWNGHIPLPIYKNIAAAQTIGFSGIDVRSSAFSDILMDKLPAPAYPFSVNVKLAGKGQKLFAKNCAACHQPNNGKVYRNMGTHMGRAEVAGAIITTGAQSGFRDICGPDLTVDLNGKESKPCGEYRGVSLKDKKYLFMTSPARHDGYNALPLIGIWAQAPYLHNGSVPTLYHMLVPGERPDSFIKSRLDYDTKYAGFAWTPGKGPMLPGEGYLYDTTSDPALGHGGHDKDIEMDGQKFKLDWSDDREGLWALLEYLKTL